MAEQQRHVTNKRNKKSNIDATQKDLRQDLDKILMSLTKIRFIQTKLMLTLDGISADFRKKLDILQMNSDQKLDTFQTKNQIELTSTKLEQIHNQTNFRQILGKFRQIQIGIGLKLDDSRHNLDGIWARFR